MRGFLHIDQFIFKISDLEKVYSFLGMAGKKKFEAVALFAGRTDGNKATIEEIIFPVQKSYKLETGLMYAVDGDELYRINKWLYSNKLKLIAQIHSHPQEAYHSEADDASPIITTLGGLSIVVPFFAKPKMDYLNWAYYRLLPKCGWTELNKNDIKTLIKVI